MKKIKGLIVGAALILSAASCSSNANQKNNQKQETIHQVSLLQGLMLGDYYGSISVKELKQMGNIGIGTLAIELSTMNCKFIPSKDLKNAISDAVVYNKTTDYGTATIDLQHTDTQERII